MPIYEYRCSSCGHELEALQKFSDPRLLTCPSCGAEALVKKVSAAGFQLKGSGWYATDFKGSGAKPAEKKDDEAKGEATGAASSEDKAGTTGDAKGDTKTEATTEAKKTETKSDSAAPAKGTGTPPAST